MRLLILLALAALAAAVPEAPYGGAAPAPTYPAPAPSYPAPPAPGYGGGGKAGYGDSYGNKKFYAPSLGERISAKLHKVGSAIEHGAHAVGAFFKDKWLTLKSDLERIAYWSHCKTERFKKYWKLKIEYEQNKRRELTRLEREKLEHFRKWCDSNKGEYEKRQKECGNKNDYDYDKDTHHGDYPPGH